MVQEGAWWQVAGVLDRISSDLSVGLYCFLVAFPAITGHVVRIAQICLSLDYMAYGTDFASVRVKEARSLHKSHWVWGGNHGCLGQGQQHGKVILLVQEQGCCFHGARCLLVRRGACNGSRCVWARDVQYLGAQTPVRCWAALESLQAAKQHLV